MYRLLILIFCFGQLPVSAKTFVVASQDFNYYPHYNFNSETDKGFIWAFLQAFSEVSGHQFEYQTMPVLRLQRELEKGTINLVYPDNSIFNKQQLFADGKIYSDTIVRTLSGTMVKSSMLGKHPHEFKRLGITLGFATQLDWRKRIDAKEVTLIPVATPINVLKILALDRIDAGDVDYFVSRYQQKNNPEFKDIQFDISLPNLIVDFKLSTINQAWLIEEINDFMQSHPEVVKSLKQQYDISEPKMILQRLNSAIPLN